MKYTTILFALILTACGPEPDQVVESDPWPETIVINNMVKPSCNWETEVYDGDIDQCVERDPEQFVFECGENEVPVERNGQIRCEFINGCPEDYLVDIDGDTWSCIQQTNQTAPECDPGYDLIERDGVYYCRSSMMMICPDGYFPVSDMLTYVECVQRDDYDETADYDRDGYSIADGDCDDTRSDIHPGATEVCDGVDNNCDGEGDVEYTFYCDQDGDGFGDANGCSTTVCELNDFVMWNFVMNDFDCNDSRSDTHPGAEEVCGDGVDQDCNLEDIECPNHGLSISKNSQSPLSGIVLGDTPLIKVAWFEINNTDEEDYDITHLTFLNCLKLNNNGLCDEYGNDEAIKSLVIGYTLRNGTSVHQTAYFHNGQAHFTDMPPMFMGGNWTADLIVFVETNPVSVSGAVSGTQFSIVLSTNSNESADTKFRAVGTDSGQVVTEDSISSSTCNIGACTGNTMTLRRTKPTISLASGSPSGAGIPGMDEVFRFNVSADSRGYVTLKEIAFRIVTSDNNHDFNLCDTLADPAKFDLYDRNDSGTMLDDVADWMFVDNDGDEVLDCSPDRIVAYAILDFKAAVATGAPEIDAGNTNTYTLKVDTTGASSAEDDAIRVDIIDINWDDDSRAEDIDGTNINSLPIQGGTIVY